MKKNQLSLSFGSFDNRFSQLNNLFFGTYHMMLHHLHLAMARIQLASVAVIGAYCIDRLKKPNKKTIRHPLRIRCIITFIFLFTLFGRTLTKTHVLLTLFVFGCLWWCPKHIALCSCFGFLRPVYIFVDCPSFNCPFGNL